MKYYEEIKHNFLLAYERSNEFFVKYVPDRDEWEDCNISFSAFLHDYEFKEISKEELLQKTNGSSPEALLKEYQMISNNNKIKPVFETSKRKLRVTIQYVFRANFNDTYWLEENEINLDDLGGDSLVWFDPFNGKSKHNSISVALAYCSDDRFVIFEKDGDKITEHEIKGYYEHIVCEDNDESTLLAAHISIR